MKSLALPLPFERTPDSRISTLRSVPSPAAPTPTKQTSRRRRAVWLAVHLPDWPLRAALSALNDTERTALEIQPLAIVDGDRRGTLLACNHPAASLGVRVGHSLNAAIALSADIQFLPRHPAREHELLQETAAQCQNYTSVVSLQPPNEILLEVRGSFRLFGGIAALIERVALDLKLKGFQPQLAMSSTANSALWLARMSRAPKVVQPHDLIPSISRLPVNVLLWPADIQLRLARFGVLTIGDLLRLPRAGLARRLGHERLAELDRAVGRHPEARHRFKSAERYIDPVPLEFEIETTGLLSIFVEKALLRLQKFLTRKNLAVERIHIDLRHREHALTPVTLGLANATADMCHVSRLMREHLSRVQLPAPVIAFTVSAQRLHPAPSTTNELFSSTGSVAAMLARTQAQARLLEQLRSRLGNSAIASVRAFADHRPECAQKTEEARVESLPADDGLPASLAPRPLWLLSQPRTILASTLRAMQVNRGASPEKIESGWWDDRLVVRDYYRMRSRRGALAWVYQNRQRADQWCLHGLFG